MQIERRKFLNSACNACLLAGAGFFFSDLFACFPSAKVLILPISENTVRLPVSAFTNQPLRIVRPQGWVIDIAVRQISTQQYDALLLECTHQQNQLSVNPNGFRCTLHGSEFSLNGQVVKGPAESSLKKFTTRIDQGQVLIKLKIPFQLTGSSVLSSKENECL